MTKFGIQMIVCEICVCMSLLFSYVQMCYMVGMVKRKKASPLVIHVYQYHLLP